MKLATEKLRQVIRLIHDDSHSNRVIGMTVGYRQTRSKTCATYSATTTKTGMI